MSFYFSSMEIYRLSLIKLVCDMCRCMCIFKYLATQGCAQGRAKVTWFAFFGWAAPSGGTFYLYIILLLWLHKYERPIIVKVRPN